VIVRMHLEQIELTGAGLAEATISGFSVQQQEDGGLNGCRVGCSCSCFCVRRREEDVGMEEKKRGSCLSRSRCLDAFYCEIRGLNEKWS